MAVREQTTSFVTTLLLEAAITSDTATNTVIIDTANDDMGITIATASTAYTDGDYAISVNESDDSGMSGATAIAGNQIVGSLPTISAVTADNADYAQFGVISNRRYLQVVITSTSTTSGATLSVLAIRGRELLPA